MEKLKVVTNMSKFEGINEKFNMEIHDDVTPAYEFGDNNIICFYGFPQTEETIKLIESLYIEKLNSDQYEDDIYYEIAEDIVKELSEKHNDCGYYIPCNGVATLDECDGMIAVEIIDGNINIFPFNESICFIIVYPTANTFEPYKALYEEAVEEIVLSNDYLGLDQWDGNNFKTGSTGIHEYIHLGKDEDGEIAYYIKRESQWQGSFDYLAKFDTKKDILEYICTLNDYDRHIEVYEEAIDQLRFF